jgi:hypothetical protein
MKWLCIDSRRPGLWAGSDSLVLPNGTFPTAPSKYIAGMRVSANDSARMLACGYRYAAIAAVTGSRSTPVISAPSGARPMKLPEPHPGSSTRPSVNPSRPSASQTSWA